MEIQAIILFLIIQFNFKEEHQDFEHLLKI